MRKTLQDIANRIDTSQANRSINQMIPIKFFNLEKSRWRIRNEPRVSKAE